MKFQIIFQYYRSFSTKFWYTMKIDLKINSTEEQRICDEMSIYMSAILLGWLLRNLVHAEKMIYPKRRNKDEIKFINYSFFLYLFF